MIFTVNKVDKEVDQMIKMKFIVLVLSKMFFIFGVSPIMGCVLLELALFCPSWAILWEPDVRAWVEMEKHKPVSSLFASACLLLTTSSLHIPLYFFPSCVFFSFSIQSAMPSPFHVYFLGWIHNGMLGQPGVGRGGSREHQLFHSPSSSSLFPAEPGENNQHT